MPAEKNFHMTPEQFRQHGRAVVDWIADYYERIETLPVLSQVEPGQIRQALPAAAPTSAESFAAMLEDMNKVILPGVITGSRLISLPIFLLMLPARRF